MDDTELQLRISLTTNGRESPSRHIPKCGRLRDPATDRGDDDPHWPNRRRSRSIGEVRARGTGAPRRYDLPGSTQPVPSRTPSTSTWNCHQISTG